MAGLDGETTWYKSLFRLPIFPLGLGLLAECSVGYGIRVSMRSEIANIEVGERDTDCTRMHAITHHTLFLISSCLVSFSQISLYFLHTTILSLCDVV